MNFMSNSLWNASYAWNLDRLKKLQVTLLYYASNAIAVVVVTLEDAVFDFNVMLDRRPRY